MEEGTERFVHNENIALYRKLIVESERDPSRDKKRHAVLQQLLAEEIAKEDKLPNGQTFVRLLPAVLTFVTVLA